jgi:pantothenate kinase-related protein Tda10
MKASMLEGMSEKQRKAFENHFNKELEKMYPKKTIDTFKVNYDIKRAIK